MFRRNRDESGQPDFQQQLTAAGDAFDQVADGAYDGAALRGAVDAVATTLSQGVHEQAIDQTAMFDRLAKYSRRAAAAAIRGADQETGADFTSKAEAYDSAKALLSEPVAPQTEPTVTRQQSMQRPKR